MAIVFAREGADVASIYLDERIDADETVKFAERDEGRCLTLSRDVG